MSNTTAAHRLGNSLTDTNDNFNDFTIGSPNPRKTANIFNVPQSIPEPSALSLCAMGLLGLLGLAVLLP